MVKPPENSFIYLTPQQAGHTLQEVGMDLLQTATTEYVSRWFHGVEGVDLFLWVDEKGSLARQQACFLGQVADWSVETGVKTGVIIEQEFQDQKIKASEVIQFDPSADSQVIRNVVEMIESIPRLEEEMKRQILKRFGRHYIPSMPTSDKSTVILPVSNVGPIEARKSLPYNNLQMTLWKRFLAFFQKRKDSK